MSLSVQQQASFISALFNTDSFSHPVDQLELIETHISWVILTGPYAYKIKKPVNLGFLDFSTLARRKHFCEEELRLNQRTAAAIYLEVVPISGTPESPSWGEGNAIIEYAVKMVQFPQAAQLDRLLASEGLTSNQIDAFALLAAAFHANIGRADLPLRYGDPEHVLQPMTENFSHIRECTDQSAYGTVLDELEQWSLTQYQQLTPLLVQRKQQGFIRECHGDLHLRNLAWVDDKPVAFDCIEFNPNLRWIDVISDIAFLVMDLDARQQVALAQRFLNRYLEINGDYHGIKLLRFYLVYRALVRAKVDAIRLVQAGMDKQERDDIASELSGYLSLARGYTESAGRRLIITHGLSGSGKTTLTQGLLEKLSVVRIRSDVERKRLAGLQAMQSGQAEAGQGIYNKAFTDRTYDYLFEQVADILDAGFSVIVDATFLQQRQRDQFWQLAMAKGVAFFILDFVAPAEILRQRIRQRSGDASDADVKVLERQLATCEPFSESEQPFVISIDTVKESEIDSTLLHL